MNALLPPLFVLTLLAPSVRADEAFDSVLTADGWTPERVQALAAGGPLSDADTADLLRLADRLRRFSDRLRDTAAGGHAADGPLSPVLLGVSIVNAARDQLAPPEREPIPFVRVRAEHAGGPLTLIANDAPRAWFTPGLPPQPAEALALRINADSAVVISWRWLPTTAHYPEVNFGEALLGSLGVDVGLLDGLADGGRLRSSESEAFYAVLSAMRRIGANQLIRFARANLPQHAAQWRDDPEASPGGRALASAALAEADEGRYPVAPLFNDAVRQRGELVVLDGVARRAVAIETAAAAGERSVSADFGVERYYEIEVFTPDSQNLPIVFCALEVPEGFPLGDRIEAPVRAAGFLFKRWAYRTRQQTARGADRPQLAPLLIGRAPVLLAPAADAGRAWGVAAGLGFAAALGGVWWAVWRADRSDSRFERAARRRAVRSPDPAALARLAEIDGLPPDAPAGQNLHDA